MYKEGGKRMNPFWDFLGRYLVAMFSGFIAIDVWLIFVWLSSQLTGELKEGWEIGAAVALVVGVGSAYYLLTKDREA